MFIDTVPEDEASGGTAAWYRSQRDAWGFLPDYAGAFSHRPEVAEAWTALSSAVRGGMDRRRYELVTVAAARALRSTYCTAAHAGFLRDVCHDQATVDALAAAPDGGSLAPRDRAVYRFAAKVAGDAAAVEQADVDALRGAGLSDPEIADVVYAVAARAFFTRVLDGLGARLDAPTARSFAPDVLAAMVVGRPPLA